MNELTIKCSIGRLLLFKKLKAILIAKIYFKRLVHFF